MNKHALSTRERHIWRFIIAGFTAKQIALHLSISPSTVKTITNNLYRKIGAHNRAQAVALYYQSWQHTSIFHRIITSLRKR